MHSLLRHSILVGESLECPASLFEAGHRLCSTVLRPILSTAIWTKRRQIEKVVNLSHGKIVYAVFLADIFKGARLCRTAYIWPVILYDFVDFRHGLNVSIQGFLSSGILYLDTPSSPCHISGQSESTLAKEPLLGEPALAPSRGLTT